MTYLNKIGAISLLIFSQLLCYSQVKVSGVIVDSNGSPVPGAAVTPFPIDKGFAGNLSWTATDENAEFHLILSEGHYELRAKGEGYPDPNLLFCADPAAVFPAVNVSKRNLSGIRVQLGSRGATIEGKVHDAATTQSIPKAKVTLCDARKSNVCVELFSDSTGRFQFTVPSKPMLITATASGYKQFLYGGGAEVTLSPDEDRRLVIDLERK